MDTPATANGSLHSGPAQRPTFNITNDTILSPPKGPQSAPDSNRRHSLPLHFLPPGLWSANTSSASLVESEEAARGEHIIDEAKVAHRISALRQLNGNRSRHRYAKSTGARNSTFNQPVIVRTYSGAARPRPERPNPIAVKKQNGTSEFTAGKMDAKLPPLEAFSFKGIMDEIRHGVAEDLERIAEICARSRYSLSNQYEVHMPPHGRGEQFLQTVGVASASSTSGNGGGPTLQAIGSDEEQTRSTGRGSRGGRRPKSAAYGTLETIMSSSRSSDEDKSKKKSAAELAEEVRGRAAKKGSQTSSSSKSKTTSPEEAIDTVEPALQQPPKHVRSKSATFASMIIDNAHGFKHEAGSLASPTSLISQPARPQTSTAADLETVSAFKQSMSMTSPTLQALMSPKPNVIRNESSASTLRSEPERRPSILDSLSSWLPWGRPPRSLRGGFQTRERSTSHAEGSLRELLQSTNTDRKGKGVNRAK